MTHIALCAGEAGTGTHLITQGVSAPHRFALDSMMLSEFGIRLSRLKLTNKSMKGGFLCTPFRSSAGSLGPKIGILSCHMHTLTFARYLACV